MLKSNMYGFGITAKSAQKIVEVFKTPQVIPSQKVYEVFSQLLICLSQIALAFLLCFLNMIMTIQSSRILFI